MHESHILARSNFSQPCRIRFVFFNVRYVFFLLSHASFALFYFTLFFVHAGTALAVIWTYFRCETYVYHSEHNNSIYYAILCFFRLR